MTYPGEIVSILLIDPSPDTLYDDYSEKELADLKKA